MNAEHRDDTDRFRVVVNGEGQHSLWPADREPPKGWTATGPAGSKAECLAYIEEHWTDLRPLSLRESAPALADQPQ